MPTRVLLTLLAPALALTLAASPAAHAQRASSYEQQVIDTTNEVRGDHRMRALSASDCLAGFADNQARRMSQQGRLSHQTLRGVLRSCGLGSVAENVAAGYRNGRTVVRSVWMRSPGHRGNILTASHRVTAVGAVRDSDGRWWTVQLLGR